MFRGFIYASPTPTRALRWFAFSPFRKGEEWADGGPQALACLRIIEFPALRSIDHLFVSFLGARTGCSSVTSTTCKLQRVLWPRYRYLLDIYLIFLLDYSGPSHDAADNDPTSSGQPAYPGKQNFHPTVTSLFHRCITQHTCIKPPAIPFSRTSFLLSAHNRISRAVYTQH